MGGKRKEFLISVGFRKNCSQVDIDQEGPRIIDFAALGALISILAEDLVEQAHSIARIVRSKVLYLTFQERSELVDYALEHGEVEFVEDAKVLDSVPLHAPLLIAGVYCHLNSLRNESILKVQVLAGDYIGQFIECLMFNDRCL